MFSNYERHIWALLNARPDMVVAQGSIGASKVLSRSDGSKLKISYKMSVTVSKVTPMKESPEQVISLEAVDQERQIKTVGEELVKSRQRVSDHGEVFTPGWLVEDMLKLVYGESDRIDSRFLEPACGSGNFLKPVFIRKLVTVQTKYGKSEFEKKHNALFSLMCIYGIDILKDNTEECREGLLEIYADYLKVKPGDCWYEAAKNVLGVNILQGDALTLTTDEGHPIVFPEWGYLGSGKFQRRDFRYDALTQRASMKDTLFELFEEHQIFVPIVTFPPMTAEEIAK
jgi:hypothetical protein